MLTNRAEEFRASLESQLSEALAVGSEARARASWVVRERLIEYVDRFLGFCQLDSIPVSALIASDLFCVITVAVDLVTRELEEESSEAIRVSWMSFVSALDTLRSTESRADAEHLRSLIAEVDLALSAAQLS